MIAWLSTTALQTQRVKSSTTSESGAYPTSIILFTSSASYTYFTSENWSISSTSSSRAGSSLDGNYEVIDLGDFDAGQTTINTTYQTTSTVTEIQSGFVTSTITEDGYFLPYVASGATYASFVETTLKTLNVTFEESATKKSTVENTITEYVGGGGVVYNTIYEAEANEVFLTMAFSAATDFSQESSYVASTATKFTLYAPSATATASQVSAIQVGGNPLPVSTVFSIDRSTITQGTVQSVVLFNELPQSTTEAEINSVSTTASQYPLVYFSSDENLNNPATTTLYYRDFTTVAATSAGISFQELQSRSSSTTRIVAGDPQVTTGSGPSSGYTEQYTFLKAQEPPILPVIAQPQEFFQTIYGAAGAVANGSIGAALSLVGFTDKITASAERAIVAGVAREDGFNYFYQTGNAPLAKLFQALPTTHTNVETYDTTSGTTILEITPDSWSASSTTANSTTQSSSSSSGVVSAIGQSYVGVFTVQQPQFNKTKSYQNFVASVTGGTVRNGETLYVSIPGGVYRIGTDTSFFSGGMTSYSASTSLARLQRITYASPVGSPLGEGLNETTGSNGVMWTVKRNSMLAPIAPEIQF